MSLQIQTTPLPGLLLLIPDRFRDARGYFMETWNQAALARAGVMTGFVQDNLSFSTAANTVRGLHFQTDPMAQAKLVRCARGAIRDVAVDLRPGSATFGQWHAEELSAENGHQLLIPAGFAHGFATRGPDCELAYKCSAPYAPGAERTILWKDPDLAIDWGLTGPPVLSDRDATAPRMAQVMPCAC